MDGGFANVTKTVSPSFTNIYTGFFFFLDLPAASGRDCMQIQQQNVPKWDDQYVSPH